ncbi:MAG: peptidoglycan editing factor PgeF [Nitrospinae bacterium]|nr:peptidoglycan editing factor PgeF [Nitrospinota bacterium]
MHLLVEPVEIARLKNFSALAHGTSPKRYSLPGGESGLLRLGADGRGGSNRQHRDWFLRSLHIGPRDVFLVKQAHGARTYVLDDLSVASAGLASLEADAIVTNLVERPIGVLTADCIPIVVYDPVLRVAGAVHAGRKGTAEKILSKTIVVMRARYGCRPENIRLGMGPGIGGCCYEVGEECVGPFAQAFFGKSPFAQKSRERKYLLDLFGANEADGRDAGVLPENIFRSGQCTACSGDAFYSYRREGPGTGRMLTVAMLRREEN